MDDDLILTDREGRLLREVIQRMGKKEKGLYTKTIGPLKVVRVDDLLGGLEALVKLDLRRGFLTPYKTLKAQGVRIRLYRRKYAL